MKVLVAGYFDPLHEGHLDHILKAAKLGDYLVIATHTDRCTEKVKGRYTIVSFRRFVLEAIIRYIGCAGEVIVTDDETMARTIREQKPDIFAKGGDRKISNMPEDELDACKEVGCEIVYGVGDLLNSSSRIKATINEV